MVQLLLILLMKLTHNVLVAVHYLLMSSVLEMIQYVYFSVRTSLLSQWVSLHHKCFDQNKASTRYRL